MALTLNHQTAAQFAARFWAAVQAAYSQDKVRFHYLVWWVWNQIQLGNLTNDQVRLSYNAAFNQSLNLAQWNSYVTSRLVPIKDRYLALQNEGAL